MPVWTLKNGSKLSYRRRDVRSFVNPDGTRWSIITVGLQTLIEIVFAGESDDPIRKELNHSSPKSAESNLLQMIKEQLREGYVENNWLPDSVWAATASDDDIRFEVIDPQLILCDQSESHFRTRSEWVRCVVAVDQLVGLTARGALESVLFDSRPWIAEFTHTALLMLGFADEAKLWSDATSGIDLRGFTQGPQRVDWHDKKAAKQLQKRLVMDDKIATLVVRVTRDHVADFL